MLRPPIAVIGSRRMATQFLPLTEGDAGTFRTVALMRRLAIAAHTDPVVRGMASQLAAPARGDVPLQIARLRRFLRDRCRFVADPRYAEAVTPPRHLLTTIRTRGHCAGDCDDVATLGAALGLSIGLPARFVVIGRQAFEHVYAELMDPGGGHWYQLDVTRPFQRIPAAYLARRVVVDL